MANALHRTTKQYLASVNTPDYQPSTWIINPDLSAVVGFDARYWIVTGDEVTLMTPAQRATVDTVLLDASRNAATANVDQVENILRAVILVLRDELNNHADKFKAILDAIDGAATLAAMKTAIAAIPDYPQRTVDQLKTAIRGKLGS